ncbi:beta-ketoacyl-ACP synthase II [Lacicoccus alkaliphilus]|uniref:3-oxoacyl-[acyl-carrier-protein] synthase 2 n=1 Tax=Lacicoccus alkaliphilus DSM 16010 TaxID=1123231 RepID=A0A1M7HN11_9BACL|nr:beta-ketoacyl-ACP synthase II [Salinicoccus alkaliphilus]SHM29941.1 3-oxoacyl-[acyl-carrier-protein] synthase II [Salinicoccus alkaliphilus DSM 16010]
MVRVVVTGMGAVTPIGNNLADMWANIRAGRHGIGPATKVNPDDYRTPVAAEVKDFDPSMVMDRREAKRMDLFAQYAVAAADEAFKMSGFVINGGNQFDAGVIVGSGSGGYMAMEDNVIRLHEKGPNKVEPLFHIKTPVNMAAANIAMRFGMKGDSMSVSSACASGSQSIGEAFMKIGQGQLTACLAGGAEATLNDSTFSGFSVLKAMSKQSDPDKASRPFDKARDGFVPGEGAGILMLESLESAQARGATIYAEISGYGATTDAHHVTAPLPDGHAAGTAMKKAMRMGGINPGEVTYINAHGTSTPANDTSETEAIKHALGESAYNTPVSSTKSYFGHMFGAAGSTEAIVCIQALREGFIPPTLNLRNRDPECDLDYVPSTGRQQPVEYALSNSMGFGGHNSSLLIKRWDE